MRRTRSGFRLAQSPVMKKVAWTWCCARISRMRAVGSDGPPASKVRAIRCLSVLPISISEARTGCTPAGVSQGEGVGCGVGVVLRVGCGIGVTVVRADGVEVAVVPVGVALGLEVAV